MSVQCIQVKIQPNQQQQRLIAKLKICSSLVRSNIFHLIIVVPVKEFWLFGPWWIPKLRNQPVFGLNPKIPSMSCPLDRFVPCGVEQTNNSYVSSANLNFQQQGQNPIRFFGAVHWLGACVFSRMRILENKGT